MHIEHTLYTTRGAVTAVAAALGISRAAVSQWRRIGIPPGRRAAIEAALAEYLASIEPTDGVFVMPARWNKPRRARDPKGANP